MSFTYNASCEKLNKTTASATNVFTGNGRLVSVTINKATTGTIAIADFDATGATSSMIGVIAASTPAQTLWYNCWIAKGLRTINPSTEDYTITYILDNQ